MGDRVEFRVTASETSVCPALRNGCSEGLLVQRRRVATRMSTYLMAVPDLCETRGRTTGAPRG